MKCAILTLALEGSAYAKERKDRNMKKLLCVLLAVMTVLALAAGLELSIDDAEAVQKSWPHFFEAIKPLGAEVEYAG